MNLSWRPWYSISPTGRIRFRQVLPSSIAGVRVHRGQQRGERGHAVTAFAAAAAASGQDLVGELAALQHADRDADRGAPRRAACAQTWRRPRSRSRSLCSMLMLARRAADARHARAAVDLAVQDALALRAGGLGALCPILHGLRLNLNVKVGGQRARGSGDMGHTGCGALPYHAAYQASWLRGSALVRRLRTGDQASRASRSKADIGFATGQPARPGSAQPAAARWAAALALPGRRSRPVRARSPWALCSRGPGYVPGGQRPARIARRSAAERPA